MVSINRNIVRYINYLPVIAVAVVVVSYIVVVITTSLEHFAFVIGLYSMHFYFENNV